ncbi:GxxExxY protein [Plebeiibacterium sediminum]|uniref:GxxExxY protein n=1 Tax=Plebeiibacterium sediminum TaxID=2992112 RepID=A0AAE3M6X9_9BACT|nr:GxxExxY protein [Plebeiobacterium sediminum]MCW3788243.1 GxxExxY protein [Plebeiobacterium sediminum]
MQKKDLTHQIIKCAYKVHNTLGSGFLEKVYENALAIELKKLNLEVKIQSPVSVYYDDEVVGEYFADIIINNEIIIELKAVSEISKIHEVQLVNYLQATKIDIGLLINFGESVQIKRKYRVYQNN